MYLYYGNHAAISESDGAGVFEVFDDFVGSSLSSLWSGSATVSDGVASISSVIYSTEEVSSDLIIEAKIRYPSTGTHVRLYAYRQDASNFIWGTTQPTNLSYVSVKTSGTWKLDSGVASILESNTWMRYQFKKTGASLNFVVSNYATEVQKSTKSASYATTFTSPRVALEAYSGPIEVDFIFVRKYIETDPTLSVVLVGVNPNYPRKASSFFLTPSSLTGQYDILIGIIHDDIEALYSILSGKETEGRYPIEVKEVLESVFQICSLSQISSLYALPGGAPLQAIYSILADLVLEYRIHIEDQIFTPDCFYSLKIVRKMDQLATASFNFVSSEAPTGTASLMRQGRVIRILYNDLVRFAGEIRQVEKDDTTGIWAISCESGACKLSDDQIETVETISDTAADEVVTALLPSTAWTGTIEAAPSIDYTTEYANILTHIVNIANLIGYDWQDRQEEYRYQVGTVTETTISVPGANWETDTHAGRYLLVLSGAGKWTSAQIASNTAEVLTLAAGAGLVTAGVAAGNAFSIFGNFVLDLVSHLGSTSPVVTMQINEDLFESFRTQDITRVYNRIVVAGSSSLTQDRNSTISGCTLNMTALVNSEAILMQNTDSTQDSFYVSSTAGFPDSGTILLDEERIAYTSKNSRYFLGCTRGYAGTTAVGHNIQTEIVLVSELQVESTDGFPSAGSIWIGMEKISYTSKTSTSFKTLTRGVDDSMVYAHAAGILVRDASYSDDDPEEGSSVAENGVRKKLVPALGVSDQNTLDRLAQEQLLALQDLQEWGTATLAATSFQADVDVGDMIAIVESDGSATTDYRLVGVTWNQSTGMISIEFGAIEEYFLDDLSRLESAVDLANARGAVASLGTVTYVSPNGEVALVELDSGESVWCRIK